MSASLGELADIFTVGACLSIVIVATTPGVELPVPAASVAVAVIETVQLSEGIRLVISASQILRVESAAARVISSSESAGFPASSACVRISRNFAFTVVSTPSLVRTKDLRPAATISPLLSKIEHLSDTVPQSNGTFVPLVYITPFALIVVISEGGVLSTFKE